MVKPQFEGTPKEVPGGFVRDDEPTRQLILERVKKQVELESADFTGSKALPIQPSKAAKATRKRFFICNTPMPKVHGGQTLTFDPWRRSRLFAPGSGGRVARRHRTPTSFPK